MPDVPAPAGAKTPDVRPILEVAVLDVRPGMEAEFEATFRQAAPIISSMPGYIAHQLRRCIEVRNRYILLVDWTSLEAHTIGFRGSPEYEGWRRLLHRFYDPLPTVEHYAIAVHSNASEGVNG